MTDTIRVFEGTKCPVCKEKFIDDGEIQLITFKDGTSYFEHRDCCYKKPSDYTYTTYIIHLI